MKNVESVYPLSPMQEGMLFHTLEDSDSGLYVTQWSGTFIGLDPAVFEVVWFKLLQRHAVLRTSFLTGDLKEPVQVVHKEVDLPLEQLDWRHLTPDEHEERFHEIEHRDRIEGFDVARAPLIRLWLIRLDNEAHRFMLSFHHLLLDGWSVSLVMQELVALYSAHCRGEDLHLAERRPYRDYIVWQRKQDFSAAESFWREELEGFTAPTPLRVDKLRERTGKQGGVGGKTRPLSIRIRPCTTDRLRRMAQQNRLTLYTLIQGAWAVVLSRYSGEQDIVFGSITLGRPVDLEGAQGMVGLFVNTLPVRVKVEEHRPLVPWLRAHQSRQLRARRFEYCPMGKIQGWSEVPPGTPMFETLLGFGNFRNAVSREDEVVGEGVRQPLSSAGFELRDSRSNDQTNLPLVLEASAPGEELVIQLRFELERFEAAAVRRLLRHMEGLLGNMADTPDGRLGELVWLGRTERHQLLVEWNDTRREGASGEALIHELFEKQVEDGRDVVAAGFENECLSYGELDRRANQVASRLAEVGVRPEARVGVRLERSLELVIGVIATLKAGGAFVPLDPHQPPMRTARVLETAKPAAILIASGSSGLAEGDGSSGVPRVEMEGSYGVGVPPRFRGHGQNLAYTIYTSGSTGVPKGSMNTHRGFLNHFFWMSRSYGLRRDDVFLQKTPFSFDVSAWEILGPLVAGARLVLTRPDAHRDAAYLLEQIARRRITTLNVVPSLLRALLEEPATEHLGALRRVVSGGEKLDEELRGRFVRRFDQVALGNHYGPTEATIDVTSWPCSRQWHGEGAASGVPIGRPFGNTSIHLLDRQLRLVPVAVPGELHIGGAGLARGYLKESARTAERFIPDAFSVSTQRGGERLYRTGDLARRRSGGELDFLGRIDHQVKLRGFRIELGEIEAALASIHCVTEVVVGMTGKHDTEIVAYVVTSGGAANGAELEATLIEELQGRLPDYMLPTTFLFLDGLPRNPSGKIDRRALADLEVDESDSLHADAFVSPRNDLERQLVEIWETIFNRSPIGVTDDFFQLGGHSLLSIRLMAMVKKQLGQRLPMATLVNGAATVERLAALIREKAVDLAWSPLVELKPDGSKPPFFCVHPIGGEVFAFRNLVPYLDAEQPLYGVQAPPLAEAEEIGIISIEDMAAHYLKAIRLRQTSGPYLLGGMSFGGAVAFEMGQQLLRMGEQVALLVLMDTRAPVQSQHMVDHDYAPIIATLAREFARQAGGSIEIEAEQIQGLDRNSQLEHVLGILQSKDLISSEMTVALLRRFVDGHQTRLRSLYNYDAAIYPGRLTLFHASERDAATLAEMPETIGSLFEDATLGWERLTEQTVDVRFVPGYHETMIYEPHVRHTAGILQQCIDDALSEPSSNRIESSHQE